MTFLLGRSPHPDRLGAARNYSFLHRKRRIIPIAYALTDRHCD
jgi:hypothetical protein